MSSSHPEVSFFLFFSFFFGLLLRGKKSNHRSLAVRRERGRDALGFAKKKSEERERVCVVVARE